MKLLIVSSEPLNPGDTFSSIFELSQAKLLGKVLDVAILSVGQAPFAVLRPVRRHVIEGVRVYEGLASPGGRFEASLKRWTAAARKGFAAYHRENGRPDVIHAHGRFLSAGAFASGAGVPYLYTDHSSLYQRGYAPDEARPVLREVVEGAAVYSTVSPSLAKAVEAFLGGEVRPAVITPNVLDPIYETAAPKPPTAGPFTFINIATLDANKGVDVLIGAFAQAFGASDERLVICGDGPLRGELEALAREVGVAERVAFLGKVSRQAVLEEIDRAHVLVISSHVETFGVAAIEAMARGRPVVSTRCGGPEGLVDENNGLLVPPGDVEALAGALQTIAATYGRYDPAAIRAGAVGLYGEAAFLERMMGLYKAAAHDRHR